MTNTKIILSSLVVAVLSFTGGIEYCNDSSAHIRRTFDQAVTAFNDAPNKAEKLQALSIMKNLDMKEYSNFDIKKLNQFHECMYRVTLQSDTTTSYNTVFEACI